MPVATQLISLIAETFVFGEAGMPTGINLLINLAVGVTCGALGNRWYLTQARAIIGDARAQGLDEDALDAKLAKRGGTNTAAALGFLVMIFISQFAVLILLEVFAGAV